MQHKIGRLNNHVIICGFGRNGRKAALELIDNKYEVVIIENKVEIIESIARIDSLMYIQGDATNDEILQIAQIEKARAIITTLPYDADNLFVVLSARDLNEHIIIISRASEEHSDSKLRQAGANNIIMPDKLGGQQMAMLVNQPDTVDFLDSILMQKDRDVRLHEVFCDNMPEGNINKTIGDFNIRKKTGANIIGLRTADGAYIFNPSKNIRLSSEDKIFVLGTFEQIKMMKEILSDTNER